MILLYWSKQCTQSRDKDDKDDKDDINGPPNTRKALIAAHLADFRNVSIANTDETIRRPCDVNYAWGTRASSARAA